jgi:choline dehydrogenase-like flavoprotein
LHSDDNGKDGATAWLSRGLESLERALGQRARRPPFDYDVLVVGSGYGGAVAAAELAGCTVDDGNGGQRPVSLCLLERGREYLPGAFPSRFAELPGHVRVETPFARQPAGPRDGLFDLRAGADVSAVVANGLGGGSLINAGVMLEPDLDAFGAAWPAALRTDRTLPAWFARARRRLGAGDDSGANTISRHAAGAPPKHAALRRLGEGSPGVAFGDAPVTIAMAPGPNQAGVLLDACKRCGDCATGCNHGAKNSLDVNLLAQAQRRGAEIYTGATVLRILPAQDGWAVEVVHTTAALRKKQRAPLQVTARRLILAAGTFGSTEILLRSRDGGLALSNMLGHRFSANGDLLVAGYGHGDAVNAVADEASAPERRGIGPTITGMLDGRAAGGFLVEEMAVPGPLRRVFEEAVCTAASLHGLATPSNAPADAGSPDPHAIDRDAFGRTALYAVMGDDGAQGVLELTPDAGPDEDGGVRVRWPGLRDSALFSRQMDSLRAMASGAGIGGRMLPHPLWQLLPPEMDSVLEVGKGPPLTVHPLGGCAMGDDCATGVVNHVGQVFDRAGGGVHAGLVVLDGAVVPAALSVNPALTIAALALRAVAALREEWGIRAPAHTDAPPPPLLRPRFRPAPGPAPAAPTEVQVLERMSGQVQLRGADGKPVTRVVELTLMFRPLAATDLARQDALLEIARDDGEASSGRLRIFAPEDWDALMGRRPAAGRHPPDPATEEMLDAAAEFIAPLSGTLHAFVREDSPYLAGTLKAIAAWLGNRGVRDTWQELSERLRLALRGEGGDRGALNLLGRARTSWALASHARHARRLEYRLEAGAPVKQAPQAHYAAGLLAGARIAGHKRLAYVRRANPWRQLTEMTLDLFPGMQAGTVPRLRLDTRFLASRQWPLLRIVGQQDQPAALADLAGLLAYVLRMMATVHTWSFRKPDAMPRRAAQRLPGRLPGLPPPEIHAFEVGQLPGGEPVRIRLTRYRRDATARQPLLMIHGYSTSGTTFAHHAVQPNLAGYFAGKGRDVWVLDMRTSAGMPTATHPWCFEDAAFADIPAAIGFIHRQVNPLPGAPVQKIDILAHCMGAAMLGMAVLKPPRGDERYFHEREALPQRIGKVMLSQVGPLVVLTPDNVLRAWIMRYVRQLLPLVDYQFNPANPSLADDLLDRLLSTLPYPDEEFDIENPPWWLFARRTPFTRIRHRMDALYGRDFSLKNLAPRTLRQMDDLFGPLSLQTVSQAMHFARFRTITTRNGVNAYVSRKNIAERWVFPTLSVHGTENGLADVATLGRMQRVFADAGVPVETLPVDGYGHQDCLIGRHAQRDVFEHMEAFLARPAAAPAARPAPEDARSAQKPPQHVLRVPWIGPLIGDDGGDGGGDHRGRLVVAAGLHPNFGSASHVVRAAVRREAGRLVLARAGELGEEPAVRVEALDDPAPQDRWFRGGVDVAIWQGKADAVLLLFAYPQADAFDPVFDKLSPLYEAMLPLAVENYLAQEDPAELEKGLVPVPAPRGAAGGNATPEMRMASPAPALCFALASCQYPAGAVDGVPAHASWRRMAQALADPVPPRRPDFLMLLGDQIYADATAGLFDPLHADDRYGAPYASLLHHPDVRAVFRRIPVYAMLDDHEVDDNWERRRGDRQGRRRLREGRAAYLRHFRQAGPPLEAPFLDSRFPLWFSFRRNQVPFFVLDTRTEREERQAANVDSARLISEGQFTKLKQWLESERHNPRPKFIASPSILLPRLRRAQHDAPASALHSDAWDGYPASMHALLAWIADNDFRDLVFLSGDEHLSCDATATITGPEGRSVRIRSIHSSALYAPYPFANAKADDLAAEEDFAFSVGDATGGRRAYACSVRTAFAPAGDGFALLRVVPDGAGWKVECTWSRESPAQPAASHERLAGVPATVTV